MTTAYYSLALGTFFQDWTNTGLITTNGDWSGVPSITGFRGDDLTTGTGTNPTTITTTSAVVDVQANQTNPNTFATGGVAEFHIANPTIALQGSGTADAPYIALYLNASGRQNITFSFNLRDIDGSADNAIQQVAVQYRTSESGAWLNVPLGYIADGTTGPSLTQVTPVSVTLPADANNSPTLQIRVMTTNAVGNDEWVGIDDIVVNSTPLIIIPDQPGAFAIADASVAEGNAGTTPITFTVTREASSNVAASVHYTITLPGGPTGASASDFSSPVLSGDLNFAANEFSKTITLQVVGDTVNEANESFTVTLSAPTNGATLADATATGTIVNDDAFVSAGAPFINEIHYDNVGGDLGEAIEIAGPAGTNLAGWTLVLYNGNGGASYDTKVLSGTVPNQDDGYGTLTFSYPANGVQNGSPDGIALVDPLGHVVQFLSYEGVMTATNGPAAGMTSTDIGVAEEPAVAVGFSLQLTGSGAVYEDFTWTSARDDNFGQVNTDQNFIGGNATGLVSVADASIVEGDSGTSQLIFTVHRAGGLDQPASVDWQLNLTGSADAADLGPGQPLSGHIDFAAGVSSVQIAVAIAGDTVGEGNDTFNLLLVNPIGNIAVTDGSAVGTILNNDPIALTIMQIQSEAHRSAYEGQPVLTSGIVTAVASNGFYLQDAAGDGNSRTSDAIFVLTGSAPTVAVGDGIHVSGTVAEFLPGGDATNLTTTEITSAVVTIDSHGNTLPAATLIGVHGILPPTQAIDDDGLAVFDPANDGIDFYESLEGMLVTIEQPLAISNTTSFGETYVVASGGAGATGVNARGGLTLSAGDYNPERIQIDDSALNPSYHPAHSQGDILSDVTGIMSYSFNSYEVLVTGNVTTISDVTLGQETTSLVGGRDHLTIASYNVENLDIGDGPAKYNVLASNIVYNLAAPDIIGLQEVQDADGAGNGSNLSGVVTAQALIDAIAAIGGPHYVYIEIAPSSAGSTGGEPGGNIRNGYLYNIDRVGYVAGSAQLIEDPAFAGSRRPLVADFTFNGETVRLINVHFTSRLGSDPLWGATQPPGDAGDAARTAQGQAVAAYVNNALATDPSLKLGVLGDFNGFYFEGAVGAIEATGLMTDLHRLNASEERYTYMFDGNAQAIDHQIVSGGLLGGAQYDVVHLNAEFANPARPTDHDPNLGRFFIEHPNEAPFDLVLDDAEIAENAPAGTLVGTIGADDPDGDALAYSLLDNAGGRFALDAATGALTITAPLDYETQASYTIVARATDPDGLAVERTLTIAVADVNEAPVALVLDDNQVAENAPAGTLVGTLSADDPDGDTLAYSLLDNAGGRFAVDAATGALTTTAPLDYEAQASYTIVARATDPDGLAVERTLTIAIADVNEAPAALVLDDNQVAENAPAGTLVGTLSADDPDGDTLAYSLLDNAGGRFAVDAATGALTTTAPLDYEAQASYTIVARATDPDGLAVDRTLIVQVTNVNEAPAALVLDDNQVAENAPAGTLVGTLSANDPDGDTLAYTLLNNAGGRFAVNAATGALTTTAPLNFEAQPSYTIVARATDPNGLAVDRTLTVQVTNVNEAPTAAADAVAVNEDATTPNLWSQLIANDSDPDAGTTLSILSVDTTGAQGHVLFDAGTQSLRYVADADAFDALAPGATTSDHFTYTVTDGQGLTSTATVAVTVTGIADGITVFAGNGNDNVNGTAGEDRLDGGNGNDNVFGLDGHDWLTGGNGNDALFGGNGNDRLYGENGNDALDGGAGNDLLAGGNGNDTMTGGAGADLFVFGKGGGNDIVTDYQIGIDKLVLEDGASVKSAKIEDVNHDGIADLSIAFSNGSGNVTLLGISHLSDVTFGAASLALYGAGGGGGGPENLSGYHMV